MSTEVNPRLPGPLENMAPLIYASLLPRLQVLARACGYSLAVHGTMRRDFDLIAVPWTDEADEAERLIHVLRAGVSPHGQVGAGPVPKPHGRTAWTVMIGGGLYLDVSVMPLLESAPTAKARPVARKVRR